MEILILHPGALGDIILSLPAITLLRRSSGLARVTIAGNLDHLIPVVSGHAERILSLSTLPLHRLYTQEEVPQEEISFWKSYDRIISWTGWGHPGFVRRLREIQPDACVAAWKPVPGDPRHVSRIFADSLGPEFSGKELAPARIFLNTAAHDEGRQWLRERGCDEGEMPIAIHPGAGSVEKRWPISRFIELARHAASRGRKVLIIEGPAEPGLAGQIAHALAPDQAVPVAGVPLTMLVPILERCSLFVGNDSGIAHLAAALAVPCVVLFGPTLPQYWAPLGPHVISLRYPQGCMGCSSRGKRHTCLENIPVDEVIRHSALWGN